MRNGALAGLRSRSPVHGLDRRKLRPIEVLAQSVSTAAPAAGMATVPAIVAATAGTATVWSFVLATAVALAVGACIATFTRRMAVAGSLYSLTAKGLGPGAAFACGAALLAGYAVLLMAVLAGATLYTDALLTRLGWQPPPAVRAGAVVVLAALAAGLVLRGVRVSARIVLAVEAVSITLMLVIFVVLLTGPPAPVPVTGPAGWSLAGVVAGVLPAMGAFIGFEAATSLGVEARRPFVTVPRAVLGTAALVGLLTLLAAHTQVIGFAGALGGQPEPVVTLAAAHGTPWLAVLLDLGIATSFVAGTLAATNALVRVLFSMARDRIVPRRIGATHRRYRTPHVAIAVAIPVGAAVPAGLFLAEVPGLTVLRGLISVATAGYLVAYLLVSLAAPLFLRRIGELTPVPVVVTVIAVPVLAGVCGAFVVSALGGAVPIVLGALVLAALAWYAVLRARRPRELAAIGVYDEPSTEDVYTGRTA
jgi:amino acid transporter